MVTPKRQQTRRVSTSVLTRIETRRIFCSARRAYLCNRDRYRCTTGLGVNVGTTGGRRDFLAGAFVATLAGVAVGSSSTWLRRRRVLVSFVDVVCARRRRRLSRSKSVAFRSSSASVSVLLHDVAQFTAVSQRGGLLSRRMLREAGRRADGLRAQTYSVGVQSSKSDTRNNSSDGSSATPPLTSCASKACRARARQQADGEVVVGASAYSPTERTTAP